MAAIQMNTPRGTFGSRRHSEGAVLLMACCMTSFKYLFDMQMLSPSDSWGELLMSFLQNDAALLLFPLSY